MFKRVFGIVLLSMGTGMLIVLIIPGWAFVAAAIMVVVGLYSLFFC